jgi:hypothetical protein
VRVALISQKFFPNWTEKRACRIKRLHQNFQLIPTHAGPRVEKRKLPSYWLWGGILALGRASVGFADTDKVGVIVWR